MASPVLPPFASLRAFEMVGRTGGVRRAAAQLGLSHAIVSRHLSSLEQHLGIVLFHRRTGELSEAGKLYHARISAAIAELEAATAASTIRAATARTLTIWCSAGFSLHWLAPRLPDFHHRAGGRGAALIELRSTDAEPAFAQDDADGDIRYVVDGSDLLRQEGVRADLLVRPEVFPVASPAFIASCAAPPVVRSDILGLPLIHEGQGEEWARWLAAQGLPSAKRPPAARFGQAHLALMAARSGQGVALANHFLVAEDLARGSLVRVTPLQERWDTAELGAYYFRSSRARWSDPLVARFRHWLKRTIAQG